MGERYRKTPILFWVTDEEKQQIENRMKLVGSSNMSAYLRKMALDGYIINLNVPELDETISLLRYSSNKLYPQNQYIMFITKINTKHDIVEL